MEAVEEHLSGDEDVEHQANQVLNKAHLKSERQLMVVLSELVNQIEQKKKGSWKR